MNNIEHLFLVVQNDGDGSQCGESYKARCRFAILKDGHSTRWLQMARSANQWLRLRDYETASAIEELKAAAEIAEYYEQHVKEFKEETTNELVAESGQFGMGA